MRSSHLAFALPDVDEAEIAAITEVIRSGWVTTGPVAQRFEDEFGKFVGVAQAVAVNSGTAAMHLALDAVGLKEGDEVITTPYTFAATAEVVRYFNARPVFVDVDRVTLNMDPGLIEAAVTGKTRAILPVHIAGQPADMDPILEIAARHKLPVVEDAAHAFPAHYKGRMIGSFGDLACYSFYATKTITTGEGGMLTTGNAEWADRCRVMRLHGISKDAWKRDTAEGSWYYEIVAPGFKYNLTDIAAAMGLAQLSKATRMWQRRVDISRRYGEAFGSLPELQVPEVMPWAGHAWQLYILRLNLDRLKISRGQFIEELRTRRIGSSVHFIPLHIHPYYREKYGYEPEDFPIAYGEYQRVVSLPIYSKMTDQDVEDVVDAVVDIVNGSRR